MGKRGHSVTLQYGQAPQSGPSLCSSKVLRQFISLIYLKEQLNKMADRKKPTFNNERSVTVIMAKQYLGSCRTLSIRKIVLRLSIPKEMSKGVVPYVSSLDMFI